MGSANKKPGKKYRPKPCMTDTVAWVVQGLMPLTTADVEVRRLRTINHSALGDISRGEGSKALALVLNNAVITTKSLASRGTGRDWLPEITLAEQAIVAILLRGHKTGRYLFTGPELTAMNLLLEIHDAQIDNCTIAEFESALHAARKARGLSPKRV